MSDPFTDNPDLVACASLVQKGDADRFAAAMAVPVSARAVLFPIYAFNIEVSRAAWASKEPIIAQMRLQWWLDTLDEIEAGGMVRRHEVVTPLALVLQGQDLRRLRDLTRARELDLEKAPFADADALDSYLDQTAGFLAVQAADALGAPKAVFPEIMYWGRAAGFVRYLQAVPELETRGKLPLPDGRPEALVAMATAQLDSLAKHRSLRRLKRAMGPAGAAVQEFWQAKPLLQQIVRDPNCVAEGRLQLSEFSRHWRLLAT
ncbi:squalene/phytoene synthase family protein [Pelagimonas varians]|uniref:Squalene/phytoene synthase n=1 Tax=Pelagimonas varians TaxID=696760 RepID=A0A238KDM6_9RHOB|nr:squalene/phytoene synthase family protein [Pelagimonas varians]PYG29876.1 phytoene/squalene synthetase [Pelagimonas varians]SMX40899.1 Squalene/phytoene synthase [Pelagimonas varians]